MSNKQAFETGAVRDTEDDKPRFELIQREFLLLLASHYPSQTSNNLPSDIEFLIHIVDVVTRLAENNELDDSAMNGLATVAGVVCNLMTNTSHNVTCLVDLPYPALERLATHMAKGAKRYSDRNWEKGIPIDRNMRSLNRHLWQFIHELKTGIRIDGEDHAAAILFNIMSAYNMYRIEQANNVTFDNTEAITY